MTSKNIIITAHRSMGRTDALDLRRRSGNMTPTQIIAEEAKVPEFNPKADYTQAPAGTPVRELVDGKYQVFTLIQPHNAAHYPGSTPSNTRSLWSLAHTKDPAYAKPWVAPLGTSGLYMEGECCTQGGKTWRSVTDNNAYSPEQYAAYWAEV